MSATEVTVRVDRDALERFYVEVLALGGLEMIRFGVEGPGQDTAYTSHIGGVIGAFEHATDVWDLTDEQDGVRLHDLAWARAHEVHRQILEEMLTKAASEAVAS